MIEETLQDLHDCGKLSAQEVADLLGLSKSSAYRYTGGVTEPTPTQLRQIIRFARNRQVAYDLLSVMAAGSGFGIFSIADDLDINGDGAIDTRDALHAAVAATQQMADVLARVHAAMEADDVGRVSGEDYDRVIGGAAQICTLMHSVQHIVEHELGRVKRRRQAKPFSSAGVSR